MTRYVQTWKSRGTVEKNVSGHVNADLHDVLEKTVLPWPAISTQPTPPRSDGRFSCAFPLELPTGTGVLRQPRAGSDFSSMEWLRHKLRYYTRHFLSTLRGQRFVWAAFNTVLLDQLHARGALLHKKNRHTPSQSRS